MKKIGYQMVVDTSWSRALGEEVVAGRLLVEEDACLVQARHRIWSKAGSSHIRLVHWIRESRIPSEMKTSLSGVSISFSSTVLPVYKERDISYTSRVT